MSQIQARIALPDSLRRRLDPLREAWSPARARDNPAHVTIVYHDEAPDAALLEQRLRETIRGTAPFPLVLGRPERFEEPVRGAFLRVSDPGGAIATIRERVLRPPFVARSRIGLHVTLLHPDDGHRLDTVWPEIRQLADLGTFPVEGLQLVTRTGRASLELKLPGVRK